MFVKLPCLESLRLPILWDWGSAVTTEETHLCPVLAGSNEKARKFFLGH